MSVNRGRRHRLARYVRLLRILPKVAFDLRQDRKINTAFRRQMRRVGPIISEAMGYRFNPLGRRAHWD